MTDSETTTHAVHIRRNSDGLVRVYHDDTPWEEGSDFLWLDGNYSCDCNRYLFFQRSADEPEIDNPACGDTAYSIVKFVLADGSEIAVKDAVNV